MSLNQTGNLPAKLKVCVGARLMLTDNISVADRLINGSRKKKGVVAPRLWWGSPKSKNHARGRREKGTRIHCDGKQWKQWNNESGRLFFFFFVTQRSFLCSPSLVLKSRYSFFCSWMCFCGFTKCATWVDANAGRRKKNGFFREITKT